MTMSAVMSLSLDPPQFWLASITGPNAGGDLLSRVSVSTTCEDQEQIAAASRAAAITKHAFLSPPGSERSAGADGTVAFVECTLEAIHPGGTTASSLKRRAWGTHGRSAGLSSRELSALAQNTRVGDNQMW
jgi:hypothetical protein